jgi:selenocysteine lyase/cysteine desulfurase
MLACQKESFSLPAGLHYLNCAYLSPLARTVEAAGLEGLQLRRDPTRITPADFFGESEVARGLFARLVCAPSSTRVALVPSVSYGLAVVARNAALRAGQQVIVAEGQFPSNVYPWRSAAARAGARVRTVAPPVEGEGRGEAWNAALLEAVDGSTALVALPQAHWADGTRFDLERIGARTREVGALLVVDGTQSVGALPFDVQRVRPDALVCAGYKWLLGPYGMGFAYLGERFDAGEPLEENWINRQGSEDFASLVDYRDEYQPGALRYDVGERSNPILLPMLSAALRLLLEWRPERIQAYCAGLTAPLVDGARALGYQVEDERWRAGHLVGLRAPEGLDVQQVQRALAARRVAVSVRGCALRISPNVYNDAGDIEALLEALRRAG